MPTGRTLFTGSGLYTSELKRIGDEKQGWGGGLIPAVEGDYYMSITVRLLRTGRLVTIHAPARARPNAVDEIDVALSGFNPRARAGRDVRRVQADHRRRVSIHAPARGATGHH